MPPLGPAMGVGEAFIDGDVCAQLTAPSNSRSSRASNVSRMTRLFIFCVLLCRDLRKSAVQGRGCRRSRTVLITAAVHQLISGLLVVEDRGLWEREIVDVRGDET